MRVVQLERRAGAGSRKRFAESKPAADRLRRTVLRRMMPGPSILRISIKLLDNCFRRSAGRRCGLHATLAFSHNMRLFVENNLKLLALSNLHPKPAPADQG
jgi:hypothetical protein